MVREIIKDVMLLMKKSTPATKADLGTARDLRDTLQANAYRCAGMAANMIGVQKRIIAVQMGMVPVVMLNPKITVHSKERYETEEGCLSLEGVRKTVRWHEIDVEFEDMFLKKRRSHYTGFTAQVIQHEIDHCDGIII